jgi:hypothetical protein
MPARNVAGQIQHHGPPASLRFLVRRQFVLADRRLGVQRGADVTGPENLAVTHFAVQGERFVATVKMNSVGEIRQLHDEYRSATLTFASESSELVAARAQLQELRQRYKDKHPSVQRQLSIIAELEKQKD